MSAQLQIAPDLAPRRPTRHTVLRTKPGPLAEVLDIPFGNKESSLFSLPYPGAEELRRAKVKAHAAHWCGLGRHWSFCVASDRCRTPIKTPCESCETYVRGGYRAGRYAVTR